MGRQAAKPDQQADGRGGRLTAPGARLLRPARFAVFEVLETYPLHEVFASAPDGVAGPHGPPATVRAAWSRGAPKPAARGKARPAEGWTTVCPALQGGTVWDSGASSVAAAAAKPSLA